MKRLFVVTFIVLFISGCSTTWHINKARDRCPECFDLDTTVTEIVSKRDTIFHIDTNVVIQLNTDTIYKDTSLKKLKPYSFKPIKVENGIINAEISMTKGVLHVATWLDSTMIYHLETEVILKDAIITELRTINTNQVITIEKQETKLKWYEKWLRIGKYVLIGLGLFLVVGIGYKIYKKLYK